MILDFYSDLQIVCNINRCAWCSYNVFFKSSHSIFYFSEKIEMTVSALLYWDRNRRYIFRRIWLKSASLYRRGIPYCQKMRGRCCRLQSEAHIILRLARFLGKARMFHYILYFPRWKWFESCLWEKIAFADTTFASGKLAAISLEQYRTVEASESWTVDMFHLIFWMSALWAEHPNRMRESKDKSTAINFLIKSPLLYAL